MPAEEARDASPAEVERNTPRAEADREPVSVGADPDAPPADGERTDRLSADGAPGHARSGRGRFDGPGADAGPAAASPVREPPSMESLSPAALLANVALTQGLFGGVLAAAAWFFQVPGVALGLSGGRVEGVAAVGVGLAFGAVLWVGNELAGALADAAGAAYDEGLRRALAPTDARQPQRHPRYLEEPRRGREDAPEQPLCERDVRQQRRRRQRLHRRRFANGTGRRRPRIDSRTVEASSPRPGVARRAVRR
jgi:hypothetical protein